MNYQTVEGPPQYLYMPIINGYKTGKYWKALFNVVSRDRDEDSLVPLRPAKSCDFAGLVYLTINP
jgi:hypothetical protein